MQSKQCPAELGAFSLGFHFINMVRMCQRGGGEVFILVLKRESAALLCIVFFLLSLARQYLLHWMHFSRMRSKGSRFTLGVWGLRVCSLDVAQPSATVRNRPQPSAVGPYGRAYGKFCRGGHFWSFQTCRCFVSRGRRGTS